MEPLCNQNISHTDVFMDQWVSDVFDVTQIQAW